MRILNYLLASISVLVGVSCRHPAESVPAPETDVTSTIAGTYGLTKLAVKDAASSTAITGTGSITITATGKTTVNMRVQTKINLSKSSSSSSDVETSYTVDRTGSDYLLMQAGKTYGIVTDKKLIVDITVQGGLLNATNTYLTGEFIR